MNQKKSQLKRLVALSALAAGFAAISVVPMHAAKTCNPRDFGAKGDGTTKDTVALQGAIDACAAQGGGTVHVNAGTYVSAPIVLKSNVTLHLDKGAKILGSPDHGDYPPITMFHLPDLQPLVGATNATNVAITGEGTIDGNGESWWQMARSIKGAGILGSGHPRPKLIIFDHCKNVRVEGVTIQNSPMWQLVPYYTDGMVIRNVRILAPQHSPNTDAIDPFSSSNLIIDHVYSDVGDDNVAIKSGPINSPGPDDPSKNITITDCTFMHGHGLSIGSELSGGAQNIRAERISFEGTDQGIRVKSNRDRGNDIGHFVFRDITMKDVKTAILISEYYPKVMPPDNEAPQAVGRLTPHFHDIVLENVTATGSGTAGVIVGLPESPVKNVVLKNVKISAGTGMSIGYADVIGEGLVVTADKGEAITKMAGANVTMR
ncbi:MAG TPA: glycoside hydrolase family 28 protein [Terracidiphilus sp.]|nr:glycoside hydrolase family 28 protein [Terracidiphilus sp.]